MLEIQHYNDIENLIKIRELTYHLIGKLTEAGFGQFSDLNLHEIIKKLNTEIGGNIINTRSMEAIEK